MESQARNNTPYFTQKSGRGGGGGGGEVVVDERQWHASAATATGEKSIERKRASFLIFLGLLFRVNAFLECPAEI